MIKIAICDDEIITCNILKEKISFHMKQLEYSFKIYCYTSTIELLRLPFNFDIILLDIKMPQITGIELARKIRENGIQCMLIFITALEEYVFEAFELEAIDYICKPVDDIRLKKALIRSINRIKEQLEKNLFIQTTHWCKSIKLSSIYYCEVINRKIYIHTQNNVIDYYCKLEELEKQLDYRFIKCHRSYLVNLDYLQEYSNKELLLENGDRIPVSRLRHKELMNSILQYMKKKEE